MRGHKYRYRNMFSLPFVWGDMWTFNVVGPPKTGPFHFPLTHKTFTQNETPDSNSRKRDAAAVPTCTADPNAAREGPQH
jgi:hypothetical protein